MSTKYELKNLATGKTSQLNAVSGTIGPEALDISSLTKEQGVFTFDPGFMATASTESKITYIDGDAGTLLYRGYPVEQLAEKSSYLEVANLLINGSLPTKTELCAFQNSITRHTMVNEQLLRFFQGFYHDAHPMAMVSAVVASMAAFYHDTTDTKIRGTEIFSHGSSRNCRPRRRGLQAHTRPAVHLSAQRSALPREHAEYVFAVP